MGSACGVSWDGTSSGELDESAIPDDDFASHYLNAGENKSDSSFPVVDGDGNLRAGNVNSAWDLRNDGEGVSEECLRKLDNAFDENVLPDTAYENNEIDVIQLEDPEPDEKYGMNLEFRAVPQEHLADGFNEHGVRVNDDGSVDVRFKAMEPGVRKGVEITDSFLRNVTEHDYSRIPLQIDHSDSQLANAGFIRPGTLQFSDGFLQVEAHIPNTGSSLRDDVIADFTHDPPQIQDISVGYDPRTVEVEKGRGSDEPRFVDAKIREFSLTPFPGGYSNGGLTPEFSAAVEQAFIEDEYSEEDEHEARSQLIKRPHILITK